MAKSIDWMYARAGCITCKRAHEYLGTTGTNPKSTQDARKERIEPADALALARKVAKVVVARGKKVVTFDLKKDDPGDETLLAYLIGPSGYLRAPSVLAGKTLVVGFTPELYSSVLDS